MSLGGDELLDVRVVATGDGDHRAATSAGDMMARHIASRMSIKDSGRSWFSLNSPPDRLGVAHPMRPFSLPLDLVQR
jgi:hypothetical protein